MPQIYLPDPILAPSTRGLSALPVRARLVERLLSVIWHDLLRRLAEPLRVTTAPNQRTVVFLGCFRIDILNAERRVTTAMLAGSLIDRTGARRPDWAPIRVKLELPATERWLAWYLSGWCPECERLGGEQAEALGEWIHGRLAAALRRLDLRGLERAFVRALALDRTVLRLGCLSALVRRQGALSARDYSLIWQNRAAFRKLARETPNLLPYFRLGLEQKKWPGPGEQPAQALARWVQSGRLSPRAWRLLANSRRWAFEPLLARQERRHWAALMNWLRLHAMLDCQRPLPARLQLAILREHVAGETDTVDLSDLEWRKLPLPVLQLAARAFARHFDADQFHRVANWAFHTNPQLDSNQMKAGWAALVVRAEQWEQAQAQRLRLEPTRWDSALPAHRVGEIEVVPLQDAYALWVEGQQLRHCAGSKVLACLGGQARLFSLRAPGAARPLATLELQPQGIHWCVAAIKGFANKPVAAGLRRVGEAVAGAYERAVR
jgi:hypothetical protein